VHGLHKTIDWRIVQCLALRLILAATLAFSGLRLLG
jgi:hypothetical protein